MMGTIDSVAARRYSGCQVRDGSRMPTVHANDIDINYEVQGEGDN